MPDVQLRIQGLDDMRRQLLAIPAKLRVRAIRNALAAGARIVRDEAKRRAPVLSPQTAAPYRRPGTLKRAISVRTSRIARRAGDVGVFVNVRPLKRNQRSAKNPADPFYWRFMEFGTKHIQPRAFLQPAAARLQDALAKIVATLGPAVAKLNNRQTP
jgi:HK97 gp10 family phage protein